MQCFVYNSISNELVVRGSEHKLIKQFVRTVDFITVNTFFTVYNNCLCWTGIPEQPKTPGVITCSHGNHIFLVLITVINSLKNMTKGL
ncbi:TPA: hypothetical protein HMT27_00545 [Escherichia coli]|uniref:Uncharacterized protein n=1 Tax=Escherichia coli TaxID=562 RepID=A0A7A9LC69_ECOLX|nr:hypothetical protein [Escherichia coli]HAG8754806.1 hypothetical protein [Escherichia coli]HAJ2826161.1 hypothetical protein [Escherichia coli]HAJ2839627.1 hypothetical protein [Escherichia coli]HAJ2844444.1 hypothetical protein [Escherichia coli]